MHTEQTAYEHAFNHRHFSLVKGLKLIEPK